MSKEIIISKETFYDEDKELYYKYIGLSDRDRTLIATAWGKTKGEATRNAELISKIKELVN